MEREEAGPGAGDRARTAGRGGVAVLGAKLFFLVVGFIQQPLLRLAIGLNDFGGLAQVLAFSNMVNNVVVSSGTQGVSRAIAGAKGHEDEALRVALRVHVPLAIVVAAVMAVVAPVYAGFERARGRERPALRAGGRGAALRPVRARSSGCSTGATSSGGRRCST